MSPSRGNLDETEGERAHCPCPQPCSGRPLGPSYAPSDGNSRSRRGPGALNTCWETMSRAVPQQK